MSKRFTLDDVDKFFDYGLDIPNRTVYMGSAEYLEDGSENGVDHLMAERIIKSLHILESQAPKGDKFITIIMNNPGGDVYHGMAIYDAIKECKNDVIIKVKGMAMSMGSIILQAGDERIMSPYSRFMIHYGYAGAGYATSKNYIRWAQEEKRSMIEMEDIYMEKIKQNHPNFDIRKLRAMLDPDTILTAQETVDLGLADKVE